MVPYFLLDGEICIMVLSPIFIFYSLKSKFDISWYQNSVSGSISVKYHRGSIDHFTEFEIHNRNVTEAKAHFASVGFIYARM